MIMDRLEQAGLYFAPDNPYYKAICFARDAAASLPDGVHLIDGRRLKANVESYETQPAHTRRFESHRLYGDVQVMLAGEERQDFAPEHAAADGNYSDERDLQFFHPPQIYTAVHLHPGCFVIYQPGELHRPGVAIGGAPQSVRKVCMKVLVRHETL
jgi:YhcH/YjgK/YiaL family protein